MDFAPLAMSKHRLDFSVIVPTFNRPSQLSACLSALEALRYERDRLEVIVVDDGSVESVEGVVARHRDRLDVSVIRQENRGPAAARNHGAEHAGGKWLAFTDDDCLPEAGWLLTLACCLEKWPGCVVGGHTVNVLGDNLYSAMGQIIVDVVSSYYNERPYQALFFASNELAMSRELFQKIGGFDETFTTSENRDLCDRCFCNGIRMIYAPECIVQHGHPLYYYSFCRQHSNYGRRAFRFLRGQLRRHSRHTWIKTGFHMSLYKWLLYPFSRIRPRQCLRLSLLLIAWQVTNLAGFIVETASFKAGKCPVRGNL